MREVSLITETFSFDEECESLLSFLFEYPYVDPVDDEPEIILIQRWD